MAYPIAADLLCSQVRGVGGSGTKPELAGQLLFEMQKQGLAPDVISYGATISACEKGSGAILR